MNDRRTSHKAKRRRAQPRTRVHMRPDFAAIMAKPPVTQADFDTWRAALTGYVEQFCANAERRWRACPERACRRMSTCMAPRRFCSNPVPAPVMTEAEEQLGLIRFKADLMNDFARIWAEREDAEDAAAAAAAPATGAAAGAAPARARARAVKRAAKRAAK